MYNTTRNRRKHRKSKKNMRMNISTSIYLGSIVILLMTITFTIGIPLQLTAGEGGECSEVSTPLTYSTYNSTEATPVSYTVSNNIPTIEKHWWEQIYDGEDIITSGATILIKQDLPSKYYPGLDFSTMQPFMDVDAITNKTSPAYNLCNSFDVYSDEYGLMRKPSADWNLGSDDYIIALGNYYKPKGVVGVRFLVVTETGFYTAVVGDEKADRDTDPHNMFSRHGNYAGLIEWIVDSSKLPRSVWRTGSIKSCGNKVIGGNIKAIYKIE